MRERIEALTITLTIGAALAFFLGILAGPPSLIEGNLGAAAVAFGALAFANMLLWIAMIGMYAQIPRD